MMDISPTSFWYVKTRKYCPEEGLINGVVSFGRVDKAYVHGIRFLSANSCSRRITNITLLVERFGWKPLYSSGMISTRSQYSLRRRARIFSRILPACATSAMPLSLPHSPYPISLFVGYHNDDIFPLLQHLHPLQIQTTIPSSLRRRAGSPLTGTLLRMASVSSCIRG